MVACSVAETYSVKSCGHASYLKALNQLDHFAAVADTANLVTVVESLLEIAFGLEIGFDFHASAGLRY